MLWIHYIYAILAIVAGLSSYGDTTLNATASGVVAPILALFGGAGIRGSLYGTLGQKVTGIVLGLLFFGTSTYWMVQSGYYVILFDVTIGGGMWVVIGFLIGLLLTPKKYAF